MRKRITLRKGDEKPTLSTRPRQRMTQHMVFYVTGAVMIAFTCGLFFYFQFFKVERGYAATTGDYRSAASGNWNSAGTWQVYNGTSWVAASVTPTSADGAIEIQTGHSVVVNANVPVDQVTIDTGAQVTVSAGTMTLNKGTGTDMTVNGILDISSTVAFNSNASVAITGTQILRSAGTITMSTGAKIDVNAKGVLRNEGGTMPVSLGYISVNSGGIYQHAMEGGTIPSATWNSGATCEITGVNLTVPASLAQTYQNFKWNCSSQTGNLNFAAAIQTVAGNFICASTGTGSIQFDQQGGNSVMSVGGNFNMQGGTCYVCTNGSSTVDIAGGFNMTGGNFAYTHSGGTTYGNISTTVKVHGDLNVTGGTMDMSQYTGSTAGMGLGVMNLYGNMTVTSPGQITETQNSRGQIVFTGSGGVVQTYVINNRILNTVDYVINAGAIVRTGNNIFTGSGDFTLMDGGGLMVESNSGITKTAASGSVQVAGTRSYGAGADYTFAGTSAQITGDGLPSLVRNLTINNPGSVRLTAAASVSGALTLTAGLCIVANDTLTLGTSTSNLGTMTRTGGWIVGSFKRWIGSTVASNILFPVGTTGHYNGANFSFTVAPTGGSILSSFITADPGTNGLPLSDAGAVCNYVAYGYWAFTPMNGFANGTCNVNFYCNGFGGITDYTMLHVLRRANSSSNWVTNGLHIPGSGSNTAPVANRTGLTSLGQFGIISASSNTLPFDLITFNAKPEANIIKITWKTSSETNNDYFTVERSMDGIEYTAIAKVDGAGNSTTVHSYSASDESPLMGYSYYRLKQIAYDGKITYSKKLVVKNSDSEKAIVIDDSYPMPFTDRFSINYTLNADDPALTFTITSLAGRVVYSERIPSKRGPNRYTYDGGGKLMPGHYVIGFSNGMFTANRTVMK